MNESLLQQYLNKNLLTIVDDDKQVNFLKDATAKIIKHLQTKTHKHKIIDYILLALNPEVSHDNKILIEAESIINKSWKRYKGLSSTRDPLKNVVRSVVLEALDKLANESDDYVSVIWLIGNNYFKIFNIESNKESEIIERFLTDIGEKYERKTVDLWSLEKKDSDIASVPKFEPRSSKGSHKTNLSNDFINASSFNQISYNNNGYNNNQSFSKQFFVNWYNSFSSLISKSISDAINAVTAQQVKSLNAFQKDISVKLNTYAREINNNIQTVGGQSLSLIGRNELLWWKESLFSKSLKKSYRDIDPFEASLVMAKDYYDILPYYTCPLSVDFFLKETLRQVIEKSEEYCLEELLDIEKLKKYYSLFYFPEDCVSNYSLLNYLLKASKEENTNIQRCLGLKENIKLSLFDFTVWCFHELQANGLVKNNL